MLHCFCARIGKELLLFTMMCLVTAVRAQPTSNDALDIIIYHGSYFKNFVWNRISSLLETGNGVVDEFGSNPLQHLNSILKLFEVLFYASQQINDVKKMFGISIIETVTCFNCLNVTKKVLNNAFNWLPLDLQNDKVTLFEVSFALRFPCLYFLVFFFCTHVSLYWLIEFERSK